MRTSARLDFRRLVPLVVALGLAATAADAQQIRVSKEAGPHYVGIPVRLQIVVGGFDEEPEPRCEPEASSPGLEVRFLGTSPQVSSSIMNINGRITQSRTVVYAFTYEVSAEQAGQYSVGPFHVSQNGKRVTGEAVRLAFGDIETDPDMRVQVVIGAESAFPGQRVPVRIEWWYGGDVESVRGVRVRCGLFDQFAFIDEPRRGDAALPIVTDKGEVKLPAELSERVWNGRKYIVLSAERVLVADRAGQFNFGPPTTTIQKVTRWKRDFFLDRVAAEVVPMRAAGEPVALAIRPLPVTGRPESFAGAVGSGFAVDVSADRTVVRVGDPIALTVQLRGDGNLESAGLPPLSADGGLSPTAFRLPDAEVAGVYADQQKVFQLTVRVMDESVSEIPAIKYSWFDPEAMVYRTAESSPIALRVMPATIVSADDVVRASADPPRETGPNGSAANQDPEAGTLRRAFTLTGADLAVETSVAQLLRDDRRALGGRMTRSALYVAGLGLLVLAVLDRRRRSIAPATLARRETLRRQRARIQAAGRLPARQAATEIADAMRQLAAAAPEVDRARLLEVSRRCESLAYAPSTDGATSPDAELVARAIAVSAEFLRAAEQTES